MWKQIRLTRPIFNQAFDCGKRSSLLIKQSQINSSLCKTQSLHLISSERNYCALLSPPASPSSEPRRKHSGFTGKQSLGRSFDDIKDQQLDEIIQFLESNSRAKQYKTYGFTLLTLIAGVIAGSYAARVFVWVLDKAGLFMFEEDDDD